MIAVVDYGAGNLGSVLRGLRRAGLEARPVRDPEALRAAPAVVLPGVGALQEAGAALRAQGLWEALLEVAQSGRPLLGICLGIQLLFGPGEEGGEGLGLLPGRVPRLRRAPKVPHMGWNQVRIVRPHPLFAGIADGSYFYFVHSYYVAPSDPEVVVAETEYGETFAVAVARGNLMGVQFHPEKSGAPGERLLRNFGEVVARARRAGD